MPLTLRPASLEDAELLLAWRNDEETRRASLHQAEIGMPEHCAWLERSLSDAARQLFIAELDGRPVGTVRADLSNEGWELSWTVAPEMRGSGLAKQMVALLAERIDGPITAVVKIGNPASARIAEHVGMRLAREADGLLYYTRP